MSEIYFIAGGFITLACISAFISAFIILLIGKIGLRDKIVMVAPKLVSQLFSCDFCLSFWTSFILAIILATIFCNSVILFIPILSAPLTRIML